MSAKFHNDLRFYTLRVNESEQQAERHAKRFMTEFKKLDKYDQMEMAQSIEIDGWEQAFEKLGV